MIRITITHADDDALDLGDERRGVGFVEISDRVADQMPASGLGLIVQGLLAGIVRGPHLVDPPRGGDAA